MYVYMRVCLRNALPCCGALLDFCYSFGVCLSTYQYVFIRRTESTPGLLLLIAWARSRTHSCTYSRSLCNLLPFIPRSPPQGGARKLDSMLKVSCEHIPLHFADEPPLVCVCWNSFCCRWHHKVTPSKRLKKHAQSGRLTEVGN